MKLRNWIVCTMRWNAMGNMEYRYMNFWTFGQIVRRRNNVRGMGVGNLYVISRGRVDGWMGGLASHLSGVLFIFGVSVVGGRLNRMKRFHLLYTIRLLLYAMHINFYF